MQHLKPDMPTTGGRDIVDGTEMEIDVGTKAETSSHIHTVDVEIKSEAEAEPHSPSCAVSTSGAKIVGVDDDHIVQLLRAQIKYYQEQLELLKQL